MRVCTTVNVTCPALGNCAGGRVDAPVLGSSATLGRSTVRIDDRAAGVSDAAADDRQYDGAIGSVPGCRVQSLDVMRYVPVASKAYMKRCLPDGFTAQAVAEAPSLAWNRDDALQDELVRRVFRRNIVRPLHFVPTAEGFGAAVRAGLGWGMFPESLVASPLDDGSFVRVSDVHLDVPLYWQCWKLDSPLVKRITEAVASAGGSLRRRRRD